MPALEEKRKLSVSVDTNRQRPESEGTTPFEIWDNSSIENFAGKYPLVFDVIGELVQNGIDAGADRLRILADYSVRNNRTLTVTDNGTGATLAMVAEAFTNVGKSIKVGPERYGKFGYGFMSPYGKCERFAFTTKHVDEGETAYRTWTFSKEILASKKIGQIPWKAESNLVFVENETATLPTKLRSHQRATWRTRVHMSGITTDSRVSKIDLDAIVTELARRFRDKILERKIDIKILFRNESGKEVPRTVTVQRFQGKPLEAHSLKNPAAGTVEFKLLLALKTADGRQGKVEFNTRAQEGLPQRLTAEQFFRCAAFHEIPVRKEAKEALLSGVFEGEILAEKVKLDKSRTAFILDDALWGFCDSLEKWFEEAGARHYEKVIRENKDIRYSRIGDEVLAFLRQLLKSQPSLVEALSKLMPNGRDILRIKEPLIRPPIDTEKPPVERPKKPDGSDTPKDKPPRKPRGKTHGGSNRGGIGLGLEFVEFETSRTPYELDLGEGVLYFNTTHQFWAYCDSTDTRLKQYQIVTAQIALVEARYADTTAGPMVHHCLYDLLKAQVMNIVNNTFLTGGTGKGTVFRELTFDN